MTHVKRYYPIKYITKCHGDDNTYHKLMSLQSLFSLENRPGYEEITKASYKT